MGRDARQRVAAELRGEPRTVRDVARALGMHVDTARYHLDNLVAAGNAVRQRARKTGRAGRPQLRYAIVDADAARAELLSVMTRLVASGGTDPVAAGEEWGQRVARSGGTAPEVIEHALAVRGFAPERTRTGFDLHDCPFWDAATGAPSVVCAMHLGMTRRLAEIADGPAAWDVTLKPFAGPRLCRVVLATNAA